MNLAKLLELRDAYHAALVTFGQQAWTEYLVDYATKHNLDSLCVAISPDDDEAGLLRMTMAVNHVELEEGMSPESDAFYAEWCSRYHSFAIDCFGDDCQSSWELESNGDGTYTVAVEGFDEEEDDDTDEQH